jgi:hypothetical protein
MHSDSPTNAAHSIVLAAPSSSELSALKTGGKGTPMQVGIGREIPRAQQSIRLHDLAWKKVDGVYRTIISVQSITARSLRVGMRLNKSVTQLECSFKGSVAISAAALVVQGNEVYWSPVIDGDTASIEFNAPAIPSQDLVLEIKNVSHIG